MLFTVRPFSTEHCHHVPIVARAQRCAMPPYPHRLSRGWCYESADYSLVITLSLNTITLRLDSIRQIVAIQTLCSFAGCGSSDFRLLSRVIKIRVDTDQRPRVVIDPGHDERGASGAAKLELPV